MNANYIYNANKNLSQIWQISTFVQVWCVMVDIWKIFFNERFIHNLSSKKRNKKSNIFLGLLFKNDIYMKQIWMKKFEYSNIRYFMWCYWFFAWLCINILVFKLKCINYQNEFLWITKHVFLHDYFINIRHVLRTRNFNFMNTNN